VPKREPDIATFRYVEILKLISLCPETPKWLSFR
jgi:hypothetical protein